MKSESSTAQGDAASLVQGEDIFFRAEDIQFANGIADAIADDLTSLELIGTSAAAINHYGRLLLKRLRQQPNIELEAYLPTGVESLVDQFNVALSSISMADATRGPNPDRPVKVFISSEISAGNARDGRMLARLVNNFPGANIKLIWVHQEAAEPEREEAIEFASKNAARWYVLTPTRAQAACILADAQKAGIENQARQLLDKIDPALLGSSAPAPAVMRHRRVAERQEPALTPFDDRAEPVFNLSAEGAVVEDDAVPPPPRRKISLLGILYGCFVVLCLSGIVVALIFPGHMQAITELLGIRLATIKPLNNVKSANPVAAATALPPLAVAANNPAEANAGKPAEVPAPPANAGVPRPGAPVATALPPATVAAMPLSAAPVNPGEQKPTAAKATEAAGSANVAKAPEKSAIALNSASGNIAPAPAKPAPVTPVVAVAPPSPKPAPVAPVVAVAPPPPKPAPVAPAVAAVPQPKPVASPAVKPLKEPEKINTAAAPVAKSPEPAKGGDQAKLEAGTEPPKNSTAVINAANKTDFFVQYVALDSLAVALAWRDAQPALNKAQIVQINVEQGSKTKFVVVSGPFRNRNAAVEFAKSKGQPAGYWIRGAGLLQAALKPAGSAARQSPSGEKKNE